jgi:hypothetical protein
MLSLGVDHHSAPTAVREALAFEGEPRQRGLDALAQDIEDCLDVVFQGLAKCDLPAAEVIAWCSAMLDNDRVGFIAREPLQSLRSHAQAAAGREPA